MFRHNLVTKQNANFIPNGNLHPTEIALLYKRNLIEGLELNENGKEITINVLWKTVIKQTIQDLIVIGRRTYTDRCDIFEEIYPYFRGKLYMLRDFDETWKKTSRYIDVRPSKPYSFLQILNKDFLLKTRKMIAH